MRRGLWNDDNFLFFPRAKMKGWSPWPGKVCTPTAEVLKTKSKSGKAQYCVWFFGTNNYAWIEEHSIKDYQEFKDRLSKTCKTSAFKEACAAVEDYISRKEQGIDVDAELFAAPDLEEMDEGELTQEISEISEDGNETEKLVDEEDETAAPKEGKDGVRI